MKTFDSVLFEHGPSFTFGTGGFNQERLRKDLRETSRENGKYIKLCVALVVVLFVGSAVLMVAYHDPAQISAITGATGCTLMGDVWAIVSLWKSKVKSDMTVALLSNLGEEDARAALNALLADAKKGKRAPARSVETPESP